MANSYLQINNTEQFAIKTFFENLFIIDNPKHRQLTITLIPNGKDLMKDLSKYCDAGSITNLSVVDGKKNVLYCSEDYDHIDSLNINLNLDMEEAEMFCNLILTKEV